MNTLGDKIKCLKLTVGTTTVKLPTLPAEHAINYGVQVIADEGNSGTVFFGGSEISATEGGYPLYAGRDILIPVEDIRQINFIATAADQVIWCFII